MLCSVSHGGWFSRSRHTSWQAAQGSACPPHTLLLYLETCHGDELRKLSFAGFTSIQLLTSSDTVSDYIRRTAKIAFFTISMIFLCKDKYISRLHRNHLIFCPTCQLGWLEGHGFTIHAIVCEGMRGLFHALFHYHVRCASSTR